MHRVPYVGPLRCVRVHPRTRRPCRGDGGGDVAASFRLDYEDADQLPSIDRLPAAITVNGVSHDPLFRYHGKDASGAGWTADGYGPNLAFMPKGGASNTYGQPSPLLGVNDLTMATLRGSGSDFFIAPLATDNVVTTGDIVFEFLVNIGNATSGKVFFDKRSGVDPGYSVSMTTSNRVSCRIATGGASATIVTATLVAYTWYHLILCVNRDEGSTNGAQWFVNGTASGAGVDASAVAASIDDSGTKFDLNDRGATGAGTGIRGGSYALVTGHTAAGIFSSGATGAAEMATLAKERFARVSGQYPVVADDSALPIAIARTGIATLAKDVGTVGSPDIQYFDVGAHWVPVHQLFDVGGVLRRGVMYPSSGTWHNEMQYSHDFTTATGYWSYVRMNEITAGLPDSPWGNADGVMGLAATAVDNTHSIVTVGDTSTGGGDEHVFSIIAKAGAQNWIIMRSTGGGADGKAFFNLATGAVGTVGADVTATGIEDLGNGWCNCWITYLDVIGNHEHRVGSAEADNDNSFTGDGTTVDTYICFAMHADEGLHAPTPAVKVVNDIGSTALTSLKWDGTGDNWDNAQGTLEVGYVAPVVASAASAQQLAQVGSSNDRAYQTISAATAAGLVVSGGVDQADISTGGSPIHDGDHHTMRTAWKANDVEHYIDDVSQGIDNTVTVPANKTGGVITTHTWAEYPVLVTKLEIWKKSKEP